MKAFFLEYRLGPQLRPWCAVLAPADRSWLELVMLKVSYMGLRWDPPSRQRDDRLTTHPQSALGPKAPDQVT